VEARAVLGLEPALHPNMEAAASAKVRVAARCWRHDLLVCCARDMPVAGLRRTFSISIFTLSSPESRSHLSATQQTVNI